MSPFQDAMHTFPEGCTVRLSECGQARPALKRLLKNFLKWIIINKLHRADLIVVIMRYCESRLSPQKIFQHSYNSIKTQIFQLKKCLNVLKIFFSLKKILSFYFVKQIVSSYFSFPSFKKHLCFFYKFPYSRFFNTIQLRTQLCHTFNIMIASISIWSIR